MKTIINSKLNERDKRIQVHQATAKAGWTDRWMAAGKQQQHRCVGEWTNGRADKQTNLTRGKSSQVVCVGGM